MEHLTESPKIKQPWEITKLEFRFIPYNMKILDGISKRESGEIIGTLGDFFKGEQVKQIFDNVLDTQIMTLKTPVQSGKAVDLPESFIFKGSYGTYKGKPTVFVNPDWDDKWHGDITHTIIEEASHALRSTKDRETIVPDIAKLDTKTYDAYREQVGELSADKLYNYINVTQEKIHKEQVIKALSEGKPIPPEVLADYPNLASKVGEKEHLT